MNNFPANTKEAAMLAKAYTLLQKKMLCWMTTEGDYCSTLLYGLTASRRESIEAVNTCNSLNWPVMGLVVQGSKCMEAGDMQYFCNERNCYIDGVDAWNASRVTAASAALPYLSISIQLDTCMTERLIREIRSLPASCIQPHPPIIALADVGIVDAFHRLITLIAQPEMFFCLAPLIVKEIHYRMLIGPLGGNIGKFYMQQRGKPHNSRNGKYAHMLTR